MAWRQRLRGVAVMAAGGTLLGLLLFVYRHLENVASRGHEPYIRPLVREVTAAWIGVCLFFPVRALARRFPLHGPGWTRRVPIRLSTPELQRAYENVDEYLLGRRSAR